MRVKISFLHYIKRVKFYYWSNLAEVTSLARLGTIIWQWNWDDPSWFERLFSMCCWFPCSVVFGRIVMIEGLNLVCVEKIERHHLTSPPLLFANVMLTCLSDNTLNGYWKLSDAFPNRGLCQVSSRPSRFCRSFVFKGCLFLAADLRPFKISRHCFKLR